MTSSSESTDVDSTASWTRLLDTLRADLAVLPELKASALARHASHKRALEDLDALLSVKRSTVETKSSAAMPVHENEPDKSPDALSHGNSKDGTGTVTAKEEKGEHATGQKSDEKLEEKSDVEAATTTDCMKQEIRTVAHAKDGKASADDSGVVKAPPPPHRPSKHASPNLAPGELGNCRISYCPIVVISAFPYKYIEGEDSERVSRAFYAVGQFWARQWDLFYVQQPETKDVLILVPEYLVTELFTEIKAELQIDVEIVDWQRDIGVALRFSACQETAPRFLGTSRSRDDCDRLREVAKTSPPMHDGGALLPKADEDEIAAFVAMVDESLFLCRNRRKGRTLAEARANASKYPPRPSKEKFAMMREKMMQLDLEKVQRYLGLAPSEHAGDEATVNPVTSDDCSPRKYKFEHRPIFISIDAEAWEMDGTITEIGISILDTLDLANVAPGDRGQDWFEWIRTFHMRIAEHRDKINVHFVKGCPDCFDFGRTETVWERFAGEIIRKAFHPPYGQISTGDEVRNVVIVGHDPQQDIRYFARAGFNPLDLPNQQPEQGIPGLMGVIDTRQLWQAYTHSKQYVKLGTVLNELDLRSWNLHNAGNDAVYTMRVMLAIAVKATEERLGLGSSVKTGIADEKEEVTKVVED